MDVTTGTPTHQKRPPGTMIGGAVSWWREARRAERVAYLIGLAMIGSGVVHLGVFALDGGPWDGPVSWRKPVTFGLAFGLTVIAVVANSSVLTLSHRPRRLVTTAFVGACTVEVVLVSMQAWRHVPSHFNRDTGVDSAVASLLAAGGAVIVAAAVTLTVAAFVAPVLARRSMVLAIRAGHVLFLVALAIGVAMIVKGVTLERTVSAQAAYDHAGSLKPGHAVPMQAIIVLPVIAWLLSFGGRDERGRVRLVALATGGYLLTTAVVIVESFAAVNPLAPGPVLGALNALGLAIVLGVGLVALTGALRTTRSERAPKSRTPATREA